MIYENYDNLFGYAISIVACLFFIDMIISASPKLKKIQKSGQICIALIMPVGLIATITSIALKHNVGLQTISDRITVSGTKVSIDALPDNISYNALEDRVLGEETSIPNNDLLYLKD